LRRSLSECRRPRRRPSVSVSVSGPSVWATKSKIARSGCA